MNEIFHIVVEDDKDLLWSFRNNENVRARLACTFDQPIIREPGSTALYFSSYDNYKAARQWLQDGCFKILTGGQSFLD